MSSTPKKKRTIFAESPDGKLYVQVKAVMHPLCAMVDGLPMIFFGKGKNAYLAIDDAIKWCVEERKHHSQEKYDTILAVMRKAKEQQDEHNRAKIEVIEK